MDFHLAQANIAQFKAPLDNPIMKEFVDFLEPVNRFAEESEGFVWRLKDDEGRSASYIESPFQDEMMAINLSLWTDLEAFKKFVYGTVHSYFLRNKKKWFDANGRSQFVMWWMPKDEIPTLQLAKEKLEFHQKHGDTVDAFTIKQLFSPEGQPIN